MGRTVYVLCLVTRSCPTLCDPENCSTPGFPVLHYLLEVLKLTSIESMMPSNHLILCHPLLLPSILPVFPQSFPLSLPFASGGQSIGASASASVLPIQGWFLTGLTSLLSKRLSIVVPESCLAGS